MDEFVSFLREISNLIKTGTVKESELFLGSVADTVRRQKIVTPGQREVVERIKNGDQRIRNTNNGFRKSSWFKYGRSTNG